ncbi:VPS10 domain-containing receptor SorCS2 [Thelohanellus kitauei]|uniref:VPS10 domain-containing receptor SorCS2 n=1 Tax=Thelohanellus kitauei TaxID=669202 RepID=A0A0C2M0Y2_THEKT|nr:VPS10 domain-containing receptor SorCS2 [Thelohanellus kitauei]
MQMQSKTRGCEENNCFVHLIIPCEINVTSAYPKEWISIFEGRYYFGDTIQRSYLVSFNGGKEWKIVPYSDFNVLVLNHGGVIFGINKVSNEIIYSLDEGQTFYHTNIYQDKETILAMLQNGIFQKEYVTILSSTEDKKSWVFTHINFSNILSDFNFNIDRKCDDKDYSTWFIPRYNGICYQGRETTYMKKNIGSLCVDERINDTVISTKNCPCSFEDFHCYAKLKSDSCEIQPIDFENTSEYADFCISDGM